MAGYGAVYSRIAFYCRFAGEPFILVFREQFILVFNGDNLNQEAYLGPNAKYVGGLEFIEAVLRWEGKSNGTPLKVTLRVLSA